MRGDRVGGHGSTDYDVVVVGSGFGGSVSALRLTEKGYRVGELEAGRRFTDETLPNTVGDVVDVPMTAHILGGAVIGDSPDTGVVDPYQRVYGAPGLHVVDGAAVSANLGVNPSLTITAQAERALALWPNLGEADPRPALGQPYVRLEPVAPRSPAVPASAPGALRLLPLTVVRSDEESSGTDVAPEPVGVG